VYYVTYKNVLKSDKGKNDLMNWLKVYWPMQKRWGATSVKLWNTNEGNKNVFFCRYTVKNLDQWNREAMGPEAETLIRALGEIVDINQMSIKITIPSTANA